MMSSPPEQTSRMRRTWAPLAVAVFLGSCLAVLVSLLAYRIRGVFLPFLVGFAIAYALNPLLDRLETRGWSRTKAVWVVTAIVFLILGLLVAVVVLVVVVQVPDAVSDMTAWVNDQIVLWEKREDPIHKHIHGHIIERYPNREDLLQRADEKTDELLNTLQRDLTEALPAALGRIGVQIQKSASALLLMLLIPLIAFHFMRHIDPFRQGVANLVPADQRTRVFAIASDINIMLGRYLRGLALVSIVNGLVSTMLLMIIGLIFGSRYAAVVGAVTGITYCIPWVGAAVSTVLAGTVGAVTATHHPVVCGLVSAGTMIGINQVFDNIVMPRIVGEKVGLHPLAILFGIMCGYAVWGLLGMIVAVPIVASINIALQKILPALQRDAAAAGAEEAAAGGDSASEGEPSAAAADEGLPAGLLEEDGAMKGQTAD